jgi:hypothetical protein
VNAEDEQHLVLRNALVMAGFAGDAPDRPNDGTLLMTPELVVRRQAIVLAVPEETGERAIEAAGRERGWVAKDQVPVVIDAGPFRVYGWAHLSGDSSLVDLLYSRYHTFIPITHAWLQHHPSVGGTSLGDDNGGGRPLVNVALVNREHIHLLAAVAAPILPDAAAPIRTLHANPDQLVSLLALAPVFQSTTQAILRLLMGSLIAERLVELRAFAPGQTILRQGDVGNTMYVVSVGEVLVERWHPGLGTRQLARLGPGEVFGEGAIVREGKRNATIRTLRESQVVALHRDGANRLMQASPRIAAALAELVAARRESGA